MLEVKDLVTTEFDQVIKKLNEIYGSMNQGSGITDLYVMALGEQIELKAYDPERKAVQERFYILLSEVSEALPEDKKHLYDKLYSIGNELGTMNYEEAFIKGIKYGATMSQFLEAKNSNTEESPLKLNAV